MPAISSLKQLASAWGNVVLDPDPFGRLERDGIVVREPLRRRLATTFVRHPPGANRLRVVEGLTAAGLVPKGARFRVRAASAALPSTTLRQGEWDVIVALRVDVLNQTLAALFETQTWPNRVPAVEVRRLLDLRVVRDFTDDLPDVEGVRLGHLRMKGPPTITVQLLRNEATLFASQAFVLEVVDSEFPATPLTRLDATFRIPVVPGTFRDQADPERFVIGWEGDAAATAADSELLVDPASPIQARDPDALALFTSRIAFGLTTFLATRRLPLAPTITVPLRPLGGDASLLVQRVELGVARRQGGDAIILGALIGPGPDPEEGTGSVNALRSSPFRANSGSNVLLQVNEALMNKLAVVSIPLVERKVRRKIASSLDKVKLGAFAPAIVNFDVDRISVALKRFNAIHVTTNAKFKDFCGPGQFDFLDLDFDATAAVQVAAVGGELSFLRPEQVSIDYTDSDLVACAITGLLDLATLVFATELITTVATLVAISLRTGSTDPVFGQVRHLFELDRPIDGTEVRPDIEVVQALVEGHSMQLLGNLTMAQDNAHTFVYARVGASPLSTGMPSDVRNALVEVVDQDDPAPSGDDLRPPTEGTSTRRVGKFEITTTIEYLEPTSDEILASARTDENGRVRFVIDRASRGGRVRVTRSSERIDTPEPEPEVTVTTVPLRERLPDIYFRVTLEDGRRFDSRTTTERLFVAFNLNNRRIGSPEAPLLLAVPPQAPPGGPVEP